MIIKRLIETEKNLTYKGWLNLEKNLREQGVLLQKDGCYLSELIEWDKEDIEGNFIKLEVIKKEKDSGHDIVWYKKKGILIVYVGQNTITIEAYIPNAPKAIITSDINTITIYSTEEGYFIPREWKLLKDFRIEYNMVMDAETDGAQKATIKEI